MFLFINQLFNFNNRQTIFSITWITHFFSISQKTKKMKSISTKYYQKIYTTFLINPIRLKKIPKKYKPEALRKTLKIKKKALNKKIAKFTSSSNIFLMKVDIQLPPPSKKLIVLVETYEINL